MTDGNEEDPRAGMGVRRLQQGRQRSEGVLSPEEVEDCRARGVPLAFDPLQIGWVRSDCGDDIVQERALSWRLAPASSGAYRFRKWAERDAAALSRMLSSPRLWDYLPEAYAGPMDPNVALGLIALSNEAEHHLVRAVEYRGEVIGQARLEFGGDDRNSAEISYWLDEASWGKGHGSAIVRLFVDICLDERPELKRLHARVHRENPASARVLIKAGFSHRPGASDDPWQIYDRSL